MTATYAHPRPAVTADVVVLTIRGGDLSVLLIRRAHAPFKGAWALPGGFVEENEPLESAAARELFEETGLPPMPMEQLGAFGNPGRDPRGHTVTVAYVAHLAAARPAVAGDDASAATWHSLGALPKLAFDHALIIHLAALRLRSRVSAGAQPALALVPDRFTLSELQHVCEAVLARRLDKRNFRARVLANGLIQPIGDVRKRGRHRPAQLYRRATAPPKRAP